MDKNQIWRVMMALVVGLLALGSAAGARAEATLPTQYTLYLSAPGNGNVAGVAYADEDIMRYSPNLNPQWAKTFDGTDAGLPASADVDAYDYRRHDALFTAYHYMSFDKPVNVPGLGTVDDSDVVLYTKSLLGNTWSMYFDGSLYGLTTDAEDIDSLTIMPNFMRFSTNGNYAVTNPSNGQELSGSGRDVLVWDASLASLNIPFFTSVEDWGVPAPNNLVNVELAQGVEGFQIFYNLLKPATLASNNVSINVGPYDIVFRNFYTSEMAVLWDASDNGFPQIDALNVIVP